MPKVLTAAEMREADRRTEELGIPNSILMENAGHRVIEFMAERFFPLGSHRIVVLCGKGNNGGDGFVIARLLHVLFRPAQLDIVAAFPEEESAPRRMAEAAGCVVHSVISPEMQRATLVIDALLGTGLSGPARGPALELIRQINSAFPGAKVTAVDVPSGMTSDSGETDGEVARADATVTFTALKPCHVLPPNCDRFGSLRVAPIGTPPELLEEATLHLSAPRYFRHLLAPRSRDSNKGSFGHVLVCGGAPGKTGAAEMAGIAALRTGAGLVTVASSASRYDWPELMTSPLPGSIEELTAAATRMNVIAIGPGLGTGDEHVAMVRQAAATTEQPLVIDADGLNALAGHSWKAREAARILTPHPGEMSRLARTTTKAVQADRLGIARQYAADCGCIVVLKGHRSVIALPDGHAWINPTGTPALATGGSGDLLTGIIAGLVAQSPDDVVAAVIGGAYLHGRAAQLAEVKWGERSFIATDLIEYLPEAMRECATAPDEL